MRLPLRAVSIVLTLALAAASDTPSAQETSAQLATDPENERDPLRQFLPPSNLYIPVPGGIAAVGDPAVEDTGEFEERKARRNGGLVIGYCLILSCSRVTHLAVLQICDNRIGGLTGKQELVLGVVRLPYGKTPGHLRALQGRNYIVNFRLNGPVEQDLLPGGVAESGTGSLKVAAKGMGPVAALEYQGLTVKALQQEDTITLQLVTAGNQATEIQYARFEVRHLCEMHFS